MSLFKKKISYHELLLLISQIGYERFITLDNDLKQNFKYNECYFYLIWQIINCFIFQRMLKYQKIIKEDSDVFEDIYYIITNTIQSKDQDDIGFAYIQIKNEILDIWKNDDDTHSNAELNKTSNYLVNEILECADNDYKDLKLFFLNILIKIHFENKKIMQNFKLIN